MNFLKNFSYSISIEEETNFVIKQSFLETLDNKKKVKICRQDEY